jgi:hypothetical protein
MPEPTLEEIINETLNELESDTDTPVEDQEETEVEAVDEVEADEADTADEDETEESDESEEEEVEEGDGADDGNTFVVKVDGEELSVTLDELKAGYSRQAHFTRSMQALKEERETFEAESAQYVETIQQIADLDAAWEANPVSVLTSLLASTENPSYALGLLVKEAAANDLLTEDALKYFGIDAATKQTWSTETELERLRREVQERVEREAQLQAKEQETAAESRVREAMQVFENQINEIVTEEGLDFPTIEEKAAFKAEILRYAKDNSILDLKKAYAALSYERERESRATAARRSKSQQKKAATKVVSRSGASAAGVSPVANQNQDLRSVIESTMKELKF